MEIGAVPSRFFEENDVLVESKVAFIIVGIDEPATTGRAKESHAGQRHSRWQPSVARQHRAPLKNKSQVSIRTQSAPPESAGVERRSHAPFSKSVAACEHGPAGCKQKIAMPGGAVLDVFHENSCGRSSLQQQQVSTRCQATCPATEQNHFEPNAKCKHIPLGTIMPDGEYFHKLQSVSYVGRQQGICEYLP